MKTFLSISVLRAHLGISQRELAAKLEITPEYLSMIENGKKNPSRKLLERINGIIQKTDGSLRYLPSDEKSLSHDTDRIDQLLKKIDSIDSRLANVEQLLIKLLSR